MKKRKKKKKSEVTESRNHPPIKSNFIAPYVCLKHSKAVAKKSWHHCSITNTETTNDWSQEQKEAQSFLINIFLNSSLDLGFKSSPSSVFGLIAGKPSGLTFLGTANVFFPLSCTLSPRPLDCLEVSMDDSLDADVPAFPVCWWDCAASYTQVLRKWKLHSPKARTRRRWKQQLFHVIWSSCNPKLRGITELSPQKKKTTDLLSCSRKAIPPKSATTILVIHKIRRFQLLVNVCMHSRYTHLLFACKMLWQTRMEGRHPQARTNMCPRNQADAHILRDGKDSNNNFKHYSFSVPCSVGALSPLESFLCFGFDRAMLSFFPRNICLFLATAAARCSSSIKSTYASPWTRTSEGINIWLQHLQN